MPKHFLVGLVAMLLQIPAMGQVTTGTCAVKSADNRVAVLELYTSEGCSSCPPADRWLSRIASHGFDSSRAIPIAWHVDYWDYIGWKDVYANSRHSDRQREMAVLAGLGFVYTPQMMLNGRDFRGWGNHGKFETAVRIINRDKAQANIELVLEPMAGRVVNARIAADAPRIKDAALHMVVTENGLSTEVKAGENNGSLLHHDYVVRDWQGPFSLEGDPVNLLRKITLKPEWNRQHLMVVVFVQHRRTGEILQAVSAEMCK